MGLTRCPSLYSDYPTKIQLTSETSPALTEASPQNALLRAALIRHRLLGRIIGPKIRLNPGTALIACETRTGSRVRAVIGNSGAAVQEQKRGE